MIGYFSLAKPKGGTGGSLESERYIFSVPSPCLVMSGHDCLNVTALAQFSSPSGQLSLGSKHIASFLGAPRLTPTNDNQLLVPEDFRVPSSLCSAHNFAKWLREHPFGYPL